MSYTCPNAPSAAAGASIPTVGAADAFTLAPGIQGPSGGLYVIPGGTTLASFGAHVGAGGYHGFSTQVPDAYGVLSTSAPTNLLSSGILNFANVNAQVQQNPWFYTRVKPGSVLTSGWFFGLFNSGLVDYTTYPAGCICFSCSSAAGESTLQLGSNDGVTTSKTDTGVPFTAMHDYGLYFQLENGTDVRWSVYDYTTATKYSGFIPAKANLPAAALGLGEIVTEVNVGAVAHDLYFRHTYVGQLGA